MPDADGPRPRPRPQRSQTPDMRGGLEPRRVRARPPPGPTRAERRAAQTRRSRPLQLITVLAVVILLVAAAVVFFFRDSDDANVTVSGDSVSANLELVLGGTENVNTGFPAQLPPDQINLIMEAVGVYVDGGLIEPLRSGEAVGDDVIALFDAGAQARLEAGDRSLVFEEGAGQLEDDLEATATPVLLTALSESDGTFPLVSALFVYNATAPLAEGTFTISRGTELTFINEEGTWKVTGYDVNLSRTPAAPATTTTGAAQ